MGSALHEQHGRPASPAWLADRKLIVLSECSYTAAYTFNALATKKADS